MPDDLRDFCVIARDNAYLIFTQSEDATNNSGEKGYYL